MSAAHTDRVAFVTGAGAGIGRAITLRLAREGARVLVSDVDLATAQETVGLVEAQGGTALAAQVDVRDRAAIAAAADLALETWGHLDLLVNNAGLVTKHSFKDLTEDAWDLVLDVNLPVGVVTGALGAPFLLWLLARGRTGRTA